MDLNKVDKAQKLRLEGSKQSLGISHASIYEKVSSLIRQKRLSEGRLLDYGGGQGQFLKHLSDKFSFALHGIDLMFTHLPKINWYVQDLNRPLQFKEDEFDLITCVEVIEHLENPRQVARNIYKSLRPGGSVFITMPNNESWRAILSYIVRGHFVAFTDSSYPAHITALNRKDLERILTEAGFADIEVSYTDSGMVPTLPTWSWQDLSLGLLTGKRYSDNIVVYAKKTTTSQSKAL